MATPFPFVSGAILTAAQLNAITELPVATKTASYVLVAADSGYNVVMNLGTATTITVNASLFVAGQVVRIHNQGVGVCALVAGTATITTTGSLALAQWGGGLLYFTSASAAIFYPSGVTASAGALVYLGGASFTTAAAVSTAALFTATYANYKIILDITAASVDSVALRWRMRVAGADSSAASYSYGVGGSKFDATTLVGAFGSSQTSGILGYLASADGNATTIDLISPQATLNTKLLSQHTGREAGGTFAAMQGGSFFGATTSFDAITFYPNSGTITGSYRVYGYANS